MARLEFRGEELYCYECESEFSVTTQDEDAIVAFCPFCGSEIENEQVEEEDLDIEEDEDY